MINSYTKLQAIIDKRQKSLKFHSHRVGIKVIIQEFYKAIYQIKGPMKTKAKRKLLVGTLKKKGYKIPNKDV